MWLPLCPTQQTHPCSSAVYTTLQPYRTSFSSMEEPRFLLSLGLGACCSLASNPLHPSSGWLLYPSKHTPKAPSTPPIPALMTLHGIFMMLAFLCSPQTINSIRASACFAWSPLYTPRLEHHMHLVSIIWLKNDWCSLLCWWPPMKHASWYSHLVWSPPLELGCTCDLL